MCMCIVDVCAFCARARACVCVCVGVCFVIACARLSFRVRLFASVAFRVRVLAFVLRACTPVFVRLCLSVCAGAFFWRLHVCAFVPVL